MSEQLTCYLVSDTPDGPRGRVAAVDADALPEGDVEIDVAFSSLNYKDALAARGNKGIARNLPHVPGIDCAGVVARSASDAVAVGEEVLVTGYDQGAPRWGGFCERVRVPADWVVALPEGLTAAQAMTYGTAGFTAAQCVGAIVDQVGRETGDVVVTGATGGVGVFAVAILAKLGYRVVASTGKPQAAEALRGLGAAEVLGRDAVTGDPAKPLLPGRWAAAVDTVGGAPLAALVRSLSHRGVVAACGLVAGTELPLTVYPFLLRGVTLAGIDSAKCPRGPRLAVWDRLAGPWRVELPDALVTTVTLDGLDDRIEQMLRGEAAGRTLVRPISESGSPRAG